MKICNRCDIEKELWDFNKSSKGTDGFRSECRACDNERSKEWHIKNNDRKKQYDTSYYIEHRDKIATRKKKKYPSQKESVIKYVNKYKKDRRKKDVMFRLLGNMRTRIGKVFSGRSKSKRTIALLGCSIEFLKIYIEKLFKPGMTWDNYGKWHIDHIYPLSLAKDGDELEKLCNYGNLQPLWATDNIKKGNRV